MSATTWRESLQAIDAFVAAHSEIEVTATGMHIPRDVREQFYGLVEQARTEVAREVLPDVAAAHDVVAQVHDVLGRLEAACGAQVELPAELVAFCNDVHLGASVTLTDRLLSYVQGSLSADEVLQDAKTQVVPVFCQLTRAAYETWMCYAAVLALRPRAAYLADTFDQKAIVCTRTNVLPVGRQKYSPVLRLPEAVFECEDGAVWALKFELSSEIDFYGSKPLRRRDFSAGGDTRGTIGRRMALLYRAPSISDVPFVANRDTRLVFPPTAVVAALWPEDFEGNLYGRAAIQRVLTLAPRAGALFVACEGCERVARTTAQAYDATFAYASGSFDSHLFDSFMSTL